MSKTLLGFVLASLLLTGSAFADSFTFLSAGSITWNNVYVNPYTAHDNTQSQDLTVYCDDWNTDFSGAPTWNAKVYKLTAGNAANFKYGTTTSNYNVSLLPGNELSVVLGTAPTPFNRYLEAAWLDDQWRDALAHGTATADTQRKLAAAGWTLFVDSAHAGTPLSDPDNGLVGAINDSGYATAVYNYLQAAQVAVVGGYTAPGWDVIVPEGTMAGGAHMQEFLVYGFSGDTSTVPEPGSVILLGTIVGLFTLTKFRHKCQA